ncbi:putative F-box protein [Senna tora]|uniref:Putative F-box protein n=1 Tax=Senna tora TaxID=362788 RepID=A0A834TRQ1_9FABA|nr:putative F-box protein [Senna tora]
MEINVSKDLYTAYDEKDVYKQVVIDDDRLNAWRDISEEENAFFDRCLQCGNTNMLYREGII